MATTKYLAAAIAAVLFAIPAYAVTVENKSADAITIGIDHGTKEEVKEIGANKSLEFDCGEGCGVTGPWGFSWLAQGDHVITTDGKSLVGAEG